MRLGILQDQCILQAPIQLAREVSLSFLRSQYANAEFAL